MTLDSRIDPRLYNDLDAAEGDKLTAYKDTLGNWTIGRGHKLPTPMAGQSWAGFTISQDVSDRYFQEDIIGVFPFVMKLPEWAHMDTDCRKNALREIAFNMRSRWVSFTETREAMQADPPDWQKVHDGLLNSVWAAQVQPHQWAADGTCRLCSAVETHCAPNDYCKGRDGRATRLARYFLKGEYP